MHFRIGLLVLCAGAATAVAQPASTDLGTLAVGTPVQVTPTIGAAEVVWYQFIVPNGTDGQYYLDIDTHGSTLAPSNDTEIGLFNSAGALIASDDDDGDGLMSQLTFGGGCGAARPVFGTSAAYNGRDGVFPAGTYYLSISGFNSTFAAGWSVVSTSANTGATVMNISYGQVTPTSGGPGIFVEACPNGDAGELPNTAAVVDTQTGPLTQIIGAIGTNDVDMFLIDICDAANFSATTVGGATSDTQLFLFTTDGLGVVFNDDNPGGGLQSTLSSSFVPSDGTYLLAVTGYNRDPVDAAGGLLWLNTPFNVERAPDGPAAGSVVSGWTGAPATGNYSIALTGACFVGPSGPICNDIDVNNDGGFFDPQDIEAFLSVYSEGPCVPASATCDGIDFNNDAGIFDPCDIDSFLLVFSEGPCTPCGI